jgi:hypothetical protein
LPISSETIVNKALSGGELKKLILADCVKLLDNEGMLSPHIGFGRVAYTITLALHLDNPFHPESVMDIASKATEAPGLAALEPPPLRDPSADAVIAGSQLDRKIVSPNVERVRAGMPVTMDVRQADNTVSRQHVTYPTDDTLGDGDVKIEDATSAAKAKWSRL